MQAYSELIYVHFKHAGISITVVVIAKSVHPFGERSLLIPPVMSRYTDFISVR